MISSEENIQVALSGSQNHPYKIPVEVRSTFLHRINSLGQDGELQIPNIIKKLSIKNILCKLCEIEYPKEQMTSISECEHNFCQGCLHQYITYKLNIMENVICPEENCIKQIDFLSNCFQALSEEYKNKYKKLKVWKQTINNPNYRLCPEEKCNGIIDISKNIYNCQQCKIEYCPQCMLKKHRGPCDINFQQNFINWKRCPSCQMFIEKNQGCDHMTCLCKYQFCYICLARWRNNNHICSQYIPRHEISLMSKQKRYTLGILMAILFPLILVATVLAITTSIILILTISILIGPPYALYIIWGKKPIFSRYIGLLILFIIFYPIAGIACACVYIWVIYNPGNGRRFFILAKFWQYWQTMLLLLQLGKIEDDNVNND